MGRNQKDRVILGFTFILGNPINGPLLLELGCQVKTLDMNNLTNVEREKARHLRQVQGYSKQRLEQLSPSKGMLTGACMVSLLYLQSVLEM